MLNRISLKINENIFVTFILILLMVIACQIIFNKQRAHAAYDGANIIDNSIFLDSNSMSKSDVQNFLASKGAGLANMNFILNCYGQDSKERQWYSSVGAPCDQSIPASHIIYYAAQIYGVNPRVILATMQKEQSLTTAPNPTSWQINQAMGYACPTSGQCGGNSTFPYQIDSGTWVLRYHYERARGNNSWWNNNGWTCGSEKKYYKPNLYPGQDVRFYDENDTLYRTHFIANAATSSFYCYTPHAYNNPQGLYGRAPFGTTGLYYSGSYNFVYYYELWFGSTRAASYSAQSVGQAVYSDSSKTKLLGWNASLLANQSAYVVIYVKNTGNITWTKDGDNKILLGTANYWDRASNFCTGGWLSCTRPAKPLEASIAPGEVATFEFPIKAPAQNSTYNETFGVLIEGKTYFPNGFTNVELKVEPEQYSWQPVFQAIYTDSSKSKIIGWNATLNPNQTAYAVIHAKNTSNVTWYNSGSNPIRVGTENTKDRNSNFCMSGWLACFRPANMKQSSVAPGEVGIFEFPITAPPYTGQYNESFNLISEGKTWFKSTGQLFALTIEDRKYSAQAVGQAVYSDNTKSTILGWNATLSPNQTAYLSVKMRNTGNFAWKKSDPSSSPRLGTANNWDRTSSFCTPDWISCTRTATMTESEVYPGEIATFEFPIKAPAQKAKYIETFGVLIEGKTYFPSGAQYFELTVQ